MNNIKLFWRELSKKNKIAVSIILICITGAILDTFDAREPPPTPKPTHNIKFEIFAETGGYPYLKNIYVKVENYSIMPDSAHKKILHDVFQEINADNILEKTICVHFMDNITFTPPSDGKLYGSRKIMDKVIVTMLRFEDNSEKIFFSYEYK
jgi:hypothetical protein